MPFPGLRFYPSQGTSQEALFGLITHVVLLEGGQFYFPFIVEKLRLTDSTQGSRKAVFNLGFPTQGRCPVQNNPFLLCCSLVFLETWTLIGEAEAPRGRLPFTHASFSVMLKTRTMAADHLQAATFLQSGVVSPISTESITNQHEPQVT